VGANYRTCAVGLLAPSQNKRPRRIGAQNPVMVLFKYLVGDTKCQYFTLQDDKQLENEMPERLSLFLSLPKATPRREWRMDPTGIKPVPSP
jgi:hypothetical protein